MPGVASVTSELSSEVVLSRGILLNRFLSTSVWNVGVVLDQILTSFNRHGGRRALHWEFDLDVDGHDGSHIYVLRSSGEPSCADRHVVRIERYILQGEISRLVGGGAPVKLADRVMNLHGCTRNHSACGIENRTVDGSKNFRLIAGKLED